MELRRFGTTAAMVPVVGQGTWYDDDLNANRAQAVAALRHGIELGMTHIDTAEMYLSGTAEEWVGEASEGQRERLFLVSKVLPGNASRRGTVAACERSLARLQTDRLDCYLLHWRGRYPLEETVSAFEELQRAGKILSWGVSNFDVDDLEELGSVPACNQVLYHLGERAVDHAVLPWCEGHGTAMVAYSPFGHDRFPGGRVLQEIGEAHGATARQVALRFLLRNGSAFVIPKASNPEHVKENAGAGELQLSDEEVAWIDQAFPMGRRPRSLPML